jgi:23S rRNA (cytidine1920-2'-O)/16S rRNA (cytidine1409-2'-O)-methyltransferase
MTRRRLDAELVRRSFFTSREQAQGAIADGRVVVAGVVATKAATQVDDAAAIDVRADDWLQTRGISAGKRASGEYVSRGAYKLLGALDACDLDVTGRDALDAGASTGGFTQVLLQRGAARVIAVDVGYGQLAWSLRSDERVTVVERTNVRYLTPDDLAFAPDLIVADLSFISLTLVLPALAGVARPGADFLLMVKPQFEVGKDKVGAGVVTDPQLRIDAVHKVADAARGIGLKIRGVSASPLPGPKGNIEYFLWMTDSRSDDGSPSRNDVGMDQDQVVAAITRAVREGPS